MQTNLTLSRHAEMRCQQRGIRAEIVDILLAYGRRRFSHGAEVYFMDKRARARARAELGRAYARIADRLDTYVVVAEDGRLITAAKRLRRMRV